MSEGKDLKKEIQPTKADQIWQQIENLKLDLYGLPAQALKKHAERKAISPDEVHLTLKSSAVLPALEIALANVNLPKGEKFEISQVANFTVVKKVPDFENL